MDVRLVRDAEPEWAPLERASELLATRRPGARMHVDRFMYMGAFETLGGRVHLYKHDKTRRYLCLDDMGHAFDWRPSATEELAPLHDLRSAVLRTINGPRRFGQPLAKDDG